jgi:hypothetical protein
MGLFIWSADKKNFATCPIRISLSQNQIKLKTKMKKNQILSAVAAVASVFCFSSAKAQFGIGGQIALQNEASYTSYGYSSPAFNFGIGANAFYNLNDNWRIGGEVNYLFPSSKDQPIVFTNSFLAFSATSTSKVSALNIPLSVSYAFLGNLNEEGFAMYGFLGVDLNMRTWKNTIAIGGASHDTSHTYFGVTPHLGVGAEYGLNENLRIFADVRGSIGHSGINNLAADQDKYNSTGEFPLLPDKYNPLFFGWNIGIRYMLGEK